MTKDEILARINDAIIEEKGVAVNMNSMFTDANLDSLGTVIALLTIDTEFNIAGDSEDPVADLDIPNLAIRDLVQLCKSSIISTSTEQNLVEITSQSQI